MASMSLQAAYDQSRQSLESNDLDRAIGLAQHILDRYPDNLEAYRILGEAYLANRQLDRAQESFERVLRSDPENIPAHVGLGITAERQGQLDRAIAEFEQALEIKPDMTELRSQLLRLYSEGFGSENAQLRLSRAGLARLYAKGHMLPQAITEFRQVINDQPDRFDAMVALAEALWRDGQEDEAIDLCRDILAERPESLKANLLLGYLLSSSGRPEGERYWQAAVRMDPYQGVAQALFESLPQDQSEPPMIEEWDEVAWRSRRAAEQQEQIAATRPMEAVTPAGTSTDSTSVFGAGWLEEPAVQAPVLSSRATPSSETDDFLASLLALDSAPPPTSSVAPISDEDLGLDADMMPFSLEDLDSTPPAKPAEQPTSAAPAAPMAPEEPTITPFSLSDLGLSDEEIASMNDLSAAPAAGEPPAAPMAPEEPTMTPFSLSDLGLSDEEIANFSNASDTAAAQPSASDDQPTITPFSLSDLGLSDDEIAGLDSLQAESEQPAPSTPAQPSLGDLSNRAGSTDAADAGDLPADLQPFSFDDLDLNAESDASARISGLPSSLQPFSLEDSPPQRPRVSGFSAPESSEDEAADEAEENAAVEPRGFSWQQASVKPEPSFLKPAREDPLVGDVSIFSKLKQQHDTQEPERAEPLPPVSIEPDEHLGLFSLDDISLRDDTEGPAPQPGTPAPEPPATAPAPEIENLEDALASGQVQPFSFADLGLSEEEVALLQGAAPEAPAAAEQPKAPAAPEIEDLQDALSSGQVQPFSLSDLGLSEDEIATIGIGDSEAQAAPDAELPEVSAPRIDEFDVEAPTSPTPNAPPQSNLASGDEEGLLVSDIKPFSLTDLGLSDEEIQALGLDSADESEESDDVGLGLTEEELEGLDGGDLNWALQPALPNTPPEESAPPADQIDSQVTSGDLVVDRLIALGHQQGYIDISDIIANFEDPEAEAARIEEIGMRLHEAKIEIRDGDEIIDMEAEYAEEPHDVEAPSEAPAAPENLTPPHSAHPSRDLDLVTEDFDTSSSAPAAQPASDEPAMTPFSLSDLGLTDEEIAALGLDTPATAEAPPAVEPTAPAEQPATVPPATEQQPPTTEPVSDEPAMTPFSLSDLGLTDEEIAALGLDSSTAESSAGAPEVSAPSEAESSDQDILGSLLETAEQAPAAPPEVAPQAPEVAPQAPEPAPAQPPEEAPVVRPAPQAATPPAAPTEASVSTGNDVLDMFLTELEAEPDNDVLRLSVARVGTQIGMTDLAVQQYKYLIRHSRLLDDVVGELRDLIADNDDAQVLQRLHRTLGDALSKQGRLREAIEEYSWKLGGPRGAR